MVWIEPFSAARLNGRPCRVRHLAQKFQEVDIDVAPLSYGLVILGYSLKPWGDEPPDGERLAHLIDRAQLTVIDYMIDLERPEAQLPGLLNRGTLRERHRIDMQMHDDVIGGTPFANRRFLVLEPAARPGAGD